MSRHHSATATVLGTAIGTALGWATAYGRTGCCIGLFLRLCHDRLPVATRGMAWGTALGLALTSDTLSMTIRELMDNAMRWCMGIIATETHGACR
ncbi:MAG: hypothetical protein LZF60_250127 [Nitrospira sp.]|nr:MAG: hypothetical protein LZF60_250127 [Nitrospira sp.]